MKNLLLLVLITISLHAKIDFSQHIDVEVADVSLSVTNIAYNDVLNLRAEPSSKSKILYRIPPDAKNLITYDKDILKKLGKNIWVSVRLGFGEGFYNGWVKAKYLKLYEKYDAITAQDLMVIYPEFLDAKKTEDGWIELSNSIDFEHYSGCDERDDPKLLDELSRFDIRLKVYYSLVDVFTEDKFYELDTYERVTKWDWFKKNSRGFAEKVNYFGLKGYKNVIGAEGCGINRYYFKVNGKILIIREPFDYNPPIVKGKKQPPPHLKFDDKDKIMRYIIKNLRVF